MVGNVAYFGMSPPSPNMKSRMNVDTSLVGVELDTGKELFVLEDACARTRSLSRVLTLTRRFLTSVTTPFQHSATVLGISKEAINTPTATALVLLQHLCNNHW